MVFGAVTCDSSSCACPGSAGIPGDSGGDSRISSSWVLLLPFGVRALEDVWLRIEVGALSFSLQAEAPLCKWICGAVQHGARHERSRKFLPLYEPVLLCDVGTAD
jgi:hypothetical protein